MHRKLAPFVVLALLMMPRPSPGAPQSAETDVASLRQALQSTCDALNRADVEWIHEHYLPEVTRFHDSGGLDIGWDERKAQAFSDFVGAGFDFALEMCAVEDARVYGDVGITAGRMSGHMTYPDGSVVKGPWRFTYLWVRQGETWKEAHHHVSLFDQD